MQLTDHQKWVLYQIVTGLREKKLPQMTMGGYAGTGKTTVLGFLHKMFPNFGVCAYTGKAANQLRKKQVPATTIHSRIYKPYFDLASKTVVFELTIDPGCEGFFVDEASMVPEDIHSDLKSFGFPIVYVGDHGQLEPVDSVFNLMQHPDYKLEEIHRNAGDIARFAERIRMGFVPRSFKGEGDSVEFVGGEPSDELLTSVDQVICAFNKTRTAINERIRKAKGYTTKLEVGEKVMCLRNNRKVGLFNGMQGTVLALREDGYRRKFMDFQFDENIMKDVWYDPSTFGQETYKFKTGQDSPNPFDYAGCITCHKAQGDEWGKVLVIEQRCKGWEHKRWAYTAASRAKEKLYWKNA